MTEIEAEIRCVKCGRVLGIYKGEHFILYTSEGTFNGLSVLCEDCFTRLFRLYAKANSEE